MSSSNICKFTTQVFPDTLSVSCFILETDMEIMKREQILMHHRMILVVKGNGFFQIDKKRLPYHTGSLIFAFENDSYSVAPTEETSFMYVDFRGRRADELLHRFDIGKSNQSFDGFDGLIPLWKESLSRASEQTIDLAAESILLYTFSRFLGESTERSSLINKIVAITEEQFTNPNLSIAEIASTLSYNAKYLSHLFKEKMGVTHSEYLRSLRIKYAISLFNHGIDSIKNVALLSGFSDPLYFSNVFKSNIGVSPKKYISNLSEK